MVTTRESLIRLDKHQVLIDINENLVSFIAKIYVNSKDQTPFNVAIVDQKTLDQNNEIAYFLVENGNYQKNFIQSQDVYQNYFLCLKSVNGPCEVNVIIEKVKIDPVTKIENRENFLNNSESKEKWVFTIIVIMIILTIGIIFYTYAKKTGNNQILKIKK